jgi:MFS transporter, ACS family, tartrate transporter
MDLTISKSEITKDSDKMIIRKITRKLIPFIGLLYIVCYLNRINVGFAALAMNQDLGFSDAVYGFGAGIFFIGYFIFQIPSNLMLEKVGVRKWIAPIAVLWGLVSMATMFVRDQYTFYTLRFLLGIAESGFFPGMMLYLTYWFPDKERGKAISLFLLGIPISIVIGGPLSGFLLMLDGTMGLAGWQWLFLLEGLPAVIMGLMVTSYLDDKPENAGWLSEDEKKRLSDMLRKEQGQSEQAVTGEKLKLRHIVGNEKVLLFSAIHITIVTGLYGVTLWIPKIIGQFSGLNNSIASSLSAIPYFAAAFSMVMVASHSDKTSERHWHYFVPVCIGAAGLLLSITADTPVFALISLTIAAAGILGALGPFWALPTAYIRGVYAAGGIAMVNAVGNLGGFLGPYIVGLLRHMTQDFKGGMITLSGLLLISGLLTLTTRKFNK